MTVTAPPEAATVEPDERDEAPAPAPAAIVAPAIDLVALEAEGHAEDRSYGRAVALGSVVGILVWTAVVFGTLRLIEPDMEAGAAFGIAAWVGIWTGLFLGGTITVGLWADKRH